MEILTQNKSSESGSILVFCLLVMILLMGFSAAHVAVAQKNIQQSNHLVSHSELYKYAESGIDLALHDLRYGISGEDGNIGTADWQPVDDVGHDGTPGTYDDGEGDGIPTPGEPNVFPVSVGPPQVGAELIVQVSDTGFPGVKRIVGSASNGEVWATIEKFSRETPFTIPRTGAVFVDPNVALDLKGQAFRIDGNDRNPDGSAGSGGALPGLTTAEGNTPGDNQAALLAQINSNQYDQVTGAGGSPSLGEVAGVDFDGIFNQFKAAQNNELSPGTYANLQTGNWAAQSLPITYVQGNLHLTGNGSGAGVLVVEGSLRITGRFSFVGVIIVRGDVVLTGGGSSVHTWGSVMVGETLTALDEEGGELEVGGQADLQYSSVGLSRVEEALISSYEFVYYRER